MKNGRQPLTSPIPLRLSSSQRREALRAVRVSGLKQQEVLRRSISAGLPMVVKQFSQKLAA